MTSLDLARRLARGGGRRDRQTTLLSVVAVAVAVAVAALTLGTVGALADRDHRTDWTRPAAAGAQAPVATQAVSTVYLGGTPVTVVRIAPAGADDRRPAPPGLDAFPEPGTVAWSPALADALADRPVLAEALGGDRQPTMLGRDALTGPDQMLAVLGVEQAAAEAVWSDVRFTGAYSPPTPVADFTGTPGDASTDTGQYLPLGWIAAVLLVVPVITLAGAASRLGAQRRGVRVAALRLAGADARTLRRLVLVESGLVAGVGVVLGSVLAVVLTVPLAQVPVGGTRFFAGDLLPDPIAWVAVALGVTALVTGSAIVAVRRPLADPLAVVGTHEQRFPVLWRVGLGVAAVAVFAQVARSEQADTALVVGALAGVFLVLNAVGPLMVSLIGRMMLRRSRRGQASDLLAARRVLEDPRGVWRMIAGVCLASFVAGFLALFSVGGSDQVVHGTERGLEVAVPAAQVEASADRARDALARAGLDATVSPTEPRALFSLMPDGQEVAALHVQLPHDQTRAARVRDVLAAEFPMAPAATGRDVTDRSEMVVGDFSRATLIVLATSFLVAAAACGITVAAAVLDRREVYRRLWQAGVPIDALESARNAETLVPLAAGAVLAALGGLAAAAPITLQTGLSLGGGLALAATVALGLLGVRVGIRASRPLLTASATA